MVSSCQFVCPFIFMCSVGLHSCFASIVMSCGVLSSLFLNWSFNYFLKFKCNPSPMWCLLFCMWGFIFMPRFDLSPKTLSNFWSFSLGWQGGVLRPHSNPFPSLIGLGLVIKLKFLWNIPFRIPTSMLICVYISSFEAWSAYYFSFSFRVLGLRPFQMSLLGICSIFFHSGVLSSFFKGELLGIKKLGCVCDNF